MNMKLDIVSSVELSDADLESVYGGDLGPGLGTGLGTGLGGDVGLAATQSGASSERVHSFSVTCDINIFSVNLILLPIINILAPTRQICANSD
jgi:hypothetical protein